MSFESVLDEPDITTDLDDDEVATATTYPATATRTGKTWTVTVHDLPPGHAVQVQGTTWQEAEEAALRSVIDLLHADPATVIVSVAPADPDAAASVRALTAARIARACVEQEERDAARTAARTLIKAGFSTRDAGAVLRVSPQRISQLAPQADT